MNGLIDTFWQLDQNELFSNLKSSTQGLTTPEADKRLDEWGPNTLKTYGSHSSFYLLLAQFKSPITLLLIVTAVLSAVLGDETNAAIILVIVLVSSILGFWQEKGATNAVNELLKMVQLQCYSIRNGHQTEIPVERVVPGDVVVLAAGDIIPGDAMVLTAEGLFVDEAAFTGETFPVEKLPGKLPADTVLAKRTNVLFMGSHVISGKATALIIKTGYSTEFGKIASALKGKEPETEFEKGIRKFGYLLMEVTLLLVIIIFATNVLLHKPVIDSFLFSLTLAVGLTPQLLPAIVSVNLSVGAKRMAGVQVIVKRLSSIENLGSMNVLCSDKTGTITEGKVLLKDAVNIAGRHNDRVLQYAGINAALQQGYRNPIDEAISLAATQIPNATLQDEIPYDFVRKRLTIQASIANTGSVIISKGAVTSILSVCSKAEDGDGQVLPVQELGAQIERQYNELSNAGYRTLGVAYKPATANSKLDTANEQDMIFIGFIALFDPPKANIANTVNRLANLGIKLKIITGDNVLIAQSLARQINIVNPKILSGAAIQKMSNAALTHQATHTDVFAEVEPNQKERIIMLLRKAGHVVGFMGDGINDAPALHMADVGISVNTGVDVAKEAADIVLLNQDLEVLAEGVTEGRKTFTNTMKYIFMATSANFGNMFSMAGASLFLPFLPLLPKQILLTNLLTDLPEMAIATDKVDPSAIQLPQRWDIHFIRRFMITFGLLSSVFDFVTFGVLLLILHAGEGTFRTGWLTESVISATLIVLVIRTPRAFFKSLPAQSLWGATLVIFLAVIIIPYTALAAWLSFTAIPGVYYAWLFLVIAAYVIAAEITKQWFYRKMLKHHRQ